MRGGLALARKASSNPGARVKMTLRSTTNPPIRLTNKVMDAIRAIPFEDRARRYWDTECKNFYLLTSRSGAMSFMVRYTKLDGKDGDFSIIRAEKCSVDMARAKAREVLAALALHNVDPVEERRRNRKAAQERPDRTFGTAADKFIKSREALRAGKRELDEVYFLNQYVVPRLGRKDLDTITQQDLEDLVDEIQLGVAARSRRKNANGKTTANACHRAIKRVFNWAIKSEWTEKRNPADFQCRHPVGIVKRRGRLNADRFRAFWETLVISYNRFDRSRSSLATMLFMVTLQRPVDIAGARCEEFDLAGRMWTIPASRTKTGVEYFIPLSDVAMELVQEAFAHSSDGEWLFPKARSAGGHMPEHSMTSRWVILRDQLVKANTLPDRDIELYDCRRFGRTQVQHALKFDQAVAEKVINHRDSPDMENRYDVQEITDLVREAQQRWGEEVCRMTGREVGAMFRVG